MVEVQQLLMSTRDFVDREPPLSWLDERFDAARADRRPAYLAVDGCHGVGVRSLVRKWYWDREGEFANGALRLDFSGQSAVGELLRDALVDLGVPAGEVPVGDDARHRRLLSLTHRMGCAWCWRRSSPRRRCGRSC